MHPHLTRRFVLLAAMPALAGCSAVSALNAAAEPIDTFDLAPVAGSRTGRRTSRTLLVATPEAPAAIASDRILIRPTPAAITYLPDARWSDDLTRVVQSLLIRSISGTTRIGYVGQADGGPVPDTALLVRIDAFEARVRPDTSIEITIDIALTLLDDRDQRVVATRSFVRTTRAADDSAAAIVAAFQSVLDVILPVMADWVVAAA